MPGDMGVSAQRGTGVVGRSESVDEGRRSRSRVGPGLKG